MLLYFYKELNGESVSEANSLLTLHRVDGPAVINKAVINIEKFNELREVTSEEYYLDGIRHREDGPAIKISYLDGGKEKYIKNGKFHRENGPAIIDYCIENDIIILDQEQWWTNGEKRDNDFFQKNYIDGPLYNIIYFNQKNFNTNKAVEKIVNQDNELKSLGWKNNHEDDCYHRINGPAYLSFYPNGNIQEEIWSINGSYHRDNDLPAVILYDSNKNILTEEWHINGEKHRSNDKPAEIIYELNQEDKPFYISKKSWYQNSILHRENAPAIIHMHNNKIKREEWCHHGKLHRDDDNPAFIEYNLISSKVKTIRWFKNGISHRDKGPADIFYNENGKKEYIEWAQNGKSHRDKKPCVISWYENGNTKSMSWQKNDIKDNKLGPAYISYHKNGKKKIEIWLINNQVHREDGPAKIFYNENEKVELVEFYLENILLKL